MTGIRKACPADAVAIARVHVETWRSAYAGVLPDAYLVSMSCERRLAHWRQTLTVGRHREPVLVAEDGAAEVIGFASFGAARRSGLPVDLPYDGEIFSLYVLPDYQGRGLGRALMEAGFKGLARAGRRAAIVWVVAANPARFFYERMGGRLVAERSERFAGAELPEYAYGWQRLVIGAAARDGESTI